MDERPASSLAATPASAGSAPGAPSPRRALTVASAIAAALLALVIAVVAALWWGLRTEPGSAWLVSMLPGVQVEAPKGTLLGDFDAQRVVVRLPGGQDTVTLTEVGWRGLTLQRAAAPGWVHVGIESLAARRVDVAITPSKSTSPLQAPADLRLPVEVDLRSLRVGELHASTLGQHPLRDIAARVQLGADAGATHRVERLMLGWDRLQASGDARIDTTAPMALSATIRLPQPPSRPGTPAPRSKGRWPPRGCRPPCVPPRHPSARRRPWTHASRCARSRPGRWATCRPARRASTWQHSAARPRPPP
jgi:translocation and assembly module TamB